MSLKPMCLSTLLLLPTGYDGDGNRVMRTIAAGTTVYVYDVQDQVA